MDGIPVNNTFMGIFKSWYTLTIPEEIPSRLALSRFIQEFLNDDQTIIDNY
jgi:hypothetical protein